jgi:hypothetical protein
VDFLDIANLKVNNAVQRSTCRSTHWCVLGDKIGVVITAENIEQNPKSIERPTTFRRWIQIDRGSFCCLKPLKKLPMNYPQAAHNWPTNVQQSPDDIPASFQKWSHKDIPTTSQQARSNLSITNSQETADELGTGYL